MRLEEIVDWLANARRSQGLSLRAAARRMGGNESGATLSHWESRAQRPRADRLIAWADSLGYELALIPKAAAAVGTAGGGQPNASDLGSVETQKGNTE